MDTNIITQQCHLLLNQSNNSKINEQLNEFFEIVSDELIKCSSSMVDFNIVTKIVTTLTAIDKNQLCKQSQLINHKLLILLRDYLTKFLFNQDKYDLVNHLSILFHTICYNCILTDENIQLFINKPLIDEMCLFFDKIENYTNDKKLPVVLDRLMKIYQRIQMFDFNLKNSILEFLFFTIAKCMVSNFFNEKIDNLPKTMLELNPMETLLFDSCIEYMYWQPYENNQIQRKHLMNMCDKLLRKVLNLISSSTQSEPLIRLAGLLSLNIMIETDDDNNIEENSVNDIYYNLIDSCISMLDHQETTIVTKRTLLSILCHCTYHIDMIVYMKNNTILKSLLLKMSEFDDSEISFNSYRILSIIMNEEDIKTLANAGKIVSLFYIYMISMIDDGIQKTAFESLLHSLKSLVQHEQIKIELINQDVLPLLIRSVIETNFYKTKIQQYALEILLALSFNKDALHILDKDTNFMHYLKTLENSTEENLKRVANHLRWQFDQNLHSSTVVKSDLLNSKLKFDIMLSYSHSDKKICFQIHENLVKDGFHVWIDRERMHDDIMGAMADAIENSEFVFICMSEAYKQSPYCQVEAQYAFQRRCKLIPIVMKAKYKPDGWLGILVSGKIYVDFTKFQFDSAYSILKNTIQEKRIAASSAHAIKTETINHSSVLHSPSVERNESVVDLPLCVNLWSEEHVRLFLINNNFTSLLPVFPRFNGRLLLQAYSMCQSNQENMFQAMRNEVMTDTTVPPLTIATYLHFLEHLKKYIPMNIKYPSQGSLSTICTIM